MFLMRFTERAYVHYTAEDVKNSPNSAVRLTFSNRHFDPKLGADLYNTYLDEYEYCEEVGFDGLMLNEHHSTPTCLGATMNLEAAILARTTKKPKALVGFQGRGFADGVQPDFCPSLLLEALIFQ